MEYFFSIQLCQLLRQYIVEVRANILTQVIQPGAFSSPEEGLTFHIREREPNGELLGLIVHDTRNKELNQSYLAERGVIGRAMPQGDILGFAPPLCLTREEADPIVERTADAVKSVFAGIGAA